MNKVEFFKMEGNARKKYLNEQLDAGRELDDILKEIDMTLEDLKSYGYMMKKGRFVFFYVYYQDFGLPKDVQGE